MTRSTPAAGAASQARSPSDCIAAPSPGATPTGGVGHVDCQWCRGCGWDRDGGLTHDCYDCAGRGVVCSFCVGPLCSDDGACLRCGTTDAERAAGIGPVSACQHRWVSLSVAGRVIDERCGSCGVEVTP